MEAQDGAGSLSESMLISRVLGRPVLAMLKKAISVSLSPRRGGTSSTTYEK
jgi:hypothetical protein